MAAPRMLLVFTLATAGVVLLIAALALKEWWLLPIALLAHAVWTAITLLTIRRATAQEDKPDPVTEARIEEEQKASNDGPDDGDERRMAI